MAYTFTTVNAGLSAFQYQHINWYDVCPNGALYAAYIPAAGSGGFIARAPSVGGTFEVLEENTTSDPDNPNALWAIGMNKLQAERVAYVKGPRATKQIYVGSYGGYTAGASIPNDFALSNNGLTYGLGYWLLTYYNMYMKISADGSTVAASGAATDTAPAHLRPSTLGETYHSGLAGFKKGTNNLASISVVSTDNLIFQGGNDTLSIACDPTGRYIMGNVFGSGKNRSSDYGATWLTMPNLPVGNWTYQFAGMDPSGLPRFLAGGATLYYTPDFGTTWQNVTGNLTSITPFPDIDGIRVLEY